VGGGGGGGGVVGLLVFEWGFWWGVGGGERGFGGWGVVFTAFVLVEGGICV